MARDARAAAPDDSQLKKWGEQTLETMDRDFPRAPDLWAAGVRLSALVAAARVDGKYLKDAKDYSWWIHEHFGNPKALSAGLTAPPDSPAADRYYDDNAWIVLDLIELHELSRDPRDLEQARRLFEFVLSGQDDTLGGGIWWRMQAHETKNTCTNAPAIVAGLGSINSVATRNVFRPHDGFTRGSIRNCSMMTVCISITFAGMDPSIKPSGRTTPR